MTPKNKALELVKTFSKKSNNLKQRTDWNYDKQCALIAVNEIINEYSNLPHFGELYLENIDYLEEVKQEIEKL